MDVKDIKKLLDAAKQAEISELTLETGDYKLSVKRGGEVVVQPQPAAAPSQPVAASPAANPTAANPVAESASALQEPPTSNLLEVTAPIVGTFYSAPSPEAPPYVKVGDKVEPGKVLCIIEAMKLMNEIEAETSGAIAEILVRNEEPVEYGQTLFRIEPG